MTRTAGAPIGCQRPSRFWGLGCPKIYHEVEDTLGRNSSNTSLNRVRRAGAISPALALISIVRAYIFYSCRAYG
ncbi:hypothetical protein, partial [Thiolapillus sp.]|uniref:hypothetical protein n=1 Tax=Thiolapillus sp. TaxID=2017437 RepID=UPI003AF68BFD